MKQTKLILCLIIFSFILKSCEKKEKQNDLQIANLKGKVKSISTSLMSYYSGGIIEKGKITNTLYNFEGFEIYSDDLGNVGGDDGEFSNSKTEIRRDANNNKLEENTKILSGTTSFKIKRVTYSYDNKDNLIKKVYYYDGVIGNTIIYKNDESGNIIEESLITSSGNSSKTNYKYDKNNNLIEERRTGCTINYEYNSNGDINKETLIMDDEKSSSITIYKYNSNGNKIKTTFINGDTPKEINYKYDLNNNLIEIDDNASGYIYNYEYDNLGNWIKEIKKSSDDTYIIERKIEYYSDNEDVNSKKENSRPGKYQVASERILSNNEIAKMDKYELKLMKNEIFARYGYIFKTAEMKAYFESQPWYQPKYEDVTSYLSDIEKRNIKLLSDYDLMENNEGLNDVKQTDNLKAIEGKFEIENYSNYLNQASKNDIKNRLTERNNFDYDRAVIISSIVFNSNNKCEVCKFYYKKKRSDRKIYHTYDYEIEDNFIKILASGDVWTIEINNDFSEFTLFSKKYYKIKY
jgi:hypothetical protein